MSPTRMQIFRHINDMLKEAKSLEDARQKFKHLVLALVLGE